ncbi:ABC transporter ATP-binding protein [uncultured Enterococcus sp.]|uniref:ABC transporter ATP-binding protein n=1 Tax=uncultured Enterococcus sp. TaxID=167972 RepID=UPI002586132C|nr:ABC transporter ATP-binding protein [uncultured Enterococcus sp.]
MAMLIEGTAITKHFGGEDQAAVLNRLTINIPKGHFISIMGPSGSGKSTLLYALSGMDTIDSGTVRFEQQRLDQLKEEQLAEVRRKQMGFVFQQPTFLKHLSLIDNIILPSLSKKKPMKVLVDQAERLMERVGILKLKDRKITQVSGGQLQRAGICRALMHAPSVVFGDEPTGALNSTAAQEIMDILLHINEQGTTVVLVTHDVKVAAQSEQVFFMEDGQINEEVYLGKYIGQNLEKRMEIINSYMLAAEGGESPTVLQKGYGKINRKDEEV